MFNLTFDPPPGEGSVLDLVVAGGNGGRPVSVTTSATGLTVVKVGVDGYGPKEIVSAVIRNTGANLTGVFAETFGRTVPVGEREGRVAGTGACPP